MRQNTAHGQKGCPRHNGLPLAGICALLVMGLLAFPNSTPAVAAMSPHGLQGVNSADTALPSTAGNWIVAEAGTGLRPHTGQMQSVTPEPGPSKKKPAPDVKMPRWMTRLPPWMGTTTPKVGSPAWKREQVETERQEREIRGVINGVCRGC